MIKVILLLYFFVSDENSNRKIPSMTSTINVNFTKLVTT